MVKMGTVLPDISHWHQMCLGNRST